MFDGRELDRYQIRVFFPERYPDQLPVVFEIGGRIPHHPDYHVFPKNGACYLFVEEDRWYGWPDGATFQKFLEVPVRNYFLSQTHYEETGRWPEGWEPRAHDLQGIMEAYGELLGTRDETVILAYMWVLSHEQTKGHWPCPCGSGLKIRQCQHRERIQRLRSKIPPELVRRRFATFKDLERRASRALLVVPGMPGAAGPE